MSNSSIARMVHSWTVDTTRTCEYICRSYEGLIELISAATDDALRNRTPRSQLAVEVSGAMVRLDLIGVSCRLPIPGHDDGSEVLLHGVLTMEDRLHLFCLSVRPPELAGEMTHLRSSPAGSVSYHLNPVGWREGSPRPIAA